MSEEKPKSTQEILLELEKRLQNTQEERVFHKPKETVIKMVSVMLQNPVGIVFLPDEGLMWIGRGGPPLSHWESLS